MKPANVATDLQVGQRLPGRLSRPRLHGFDYTGRNAYHIVVATQGRLGVFKSSDLAESACRVLEQEAAKQRFHLLAYCLMPDHLHLLAMGQTDESNLTRFMQVFKQRTGYAYRQTSGRQLWQASYHDHILRRDEDIEAIARYIFSNPVEAGLVEAVADYRFCGGASFERIGDRAEAPSLRVASSAVQEGGNG